MKSLIHVAWSWARPLLGLGAIGGAGLVFSAFVSPQFLLTLESADGVAPDFEMCLRVYLGIAIAAILAVTALFGWQHYTGLHRTIWWFGTAGAVILLFIFVADPGNHLMDEYSWIRYPTAGALILAGGVALQNMFRARSREASFRQYVVPLVLGVGFVFAGLDELLKIHEKASKLLTFSDHPSVMNDLFSIVYAMIGLGVLYGLWHWFIRPQLTERAQRTPEESHVVLSPVLVRGYVTAVCIFGVSQMFDSVDKLVLIIMREAAETLATAGHRFPDFWYITYSPRHLMNSVEEILEFSAAILFLVFTWWGSRVRAVEEQPVTIPHLSGWWRFGQVAIVAGALILLATGWSSATAGSPLAGKEAVVSVAASRARLFEELKLKELDIAIADTAVDQNGVELTVEGSHLIRRTKGSEKRLRTRLMFRDVRGTAINGDETLVFATSSSPESFLPHIVWSVDADE